MSSTETTRIERIIRVCTRGKQCTGSIDGKTFRYADGSVDEGHEEILVYITVGGRRTGWTEPLRPLQRKPSKDNWPKKYLKH